MIILHAGFQEKHLLPWGETALSEAETKSKPAGASPKSPAKPAKLICDVGADGLHSALSEFFSCVEIEKGEFENVAIWLPTVAASFGGVGVVMKSSQLNQLLHQ